MKKQLGEVWSAYSILARYDVMKKLDLDNFSHTRAIAKSFYLVTQEMTLSYETFLHFIAS